MSKKVGPGKHRTNREAVHTRSIKRYRREQASIEYISTYAWALIIIVIVIAALLIYVNLPTSLAQSRCSFAIGFDCNAFVLGTNTITHNITVATAISNRLPEPIENPSLVVNLAGSNYTGTCTPSYLPPGGSGTCIFNITAKANLGQYFASSIYIKADYCGVSPTGCSSPAPEVYIGSEQSHASIFVSPNVTINLNVKNNPAPTNALDPIYAQVYMLGYPIRGALVNFTTNNTNYTTAPSSELTSSSGFVNSTLTGADPGEVLLTASYGSYKASKAVTFVYVPTTTTSTTSTTVTVPCGCTTITSTVTVPTVITVIPTTTGTTINYAYVVVSGPTVDIVQNNVVINTVSGTLYNPKGIAFDPNGKYAWVADDGNNGPIAVINTTTASVVNQIQSNCYTTGIAFAPNGTRAYASCAQIDGSSVNWIEVYNVTENGKSGSILTTYEQGTSYNMSGIAIAPNGTIVYTTGNTTGGNQNVSIVKVTPPLQSLGYITPTSGDPFPNPSGVAFNPNGKYAYVVNNGNDGPIGIISTASRSKIGDISSNYYTCGIAVQNSGAYAYAAACATPSGANSQLETISLTDGGSSGNVIGYITLTAAPAGIAVAPQNFKSTSTTTTSTTRSTTACPVAHTCQPQ